MYIQLYIYERYKYMERMLYVEKKLRSFQMVYGTYNSGMCCKGLHRLIFYKAITFFLPFLKGTLAWDFLFSFFALIKHILGIGQIIRLLNFFDFVLEFADLFDFFNIRRWLSWRGVSFLVNWVKAKWDSTSTESTKSETPRQLSQRGMIKSS
jgi:hypothetical protein